MKLISILCCAMLGATATADCQYYNISDPQLSDAITQCASILQGTVISEQYTGNGWLATCQYSCTPNGGGYGPTCSYYNVSDPQLSDAVTQCESILQGQPISQQYTGTGWIVQCQYACH